MQRCSKSVDFVASVRAPNIEFSVHYCCVDRCVVCFPIITGSPLEIARSDCDLTELYIYLCTPAADCVT